MSIINSAKEFFGLTPADMDHDDAYYDEQPRYNGSAAYAPQRDYYEPRRLPATVVPVELRGYDQATEIGEPFRDGDAVVFDLSRMDSADAKRVVDFAAGLCFALRGSMTKLDGRVFAIIPDGADICIIELERAARLR